MKKLLTIMVIGTLFMCSTMHGGFVYSDYNWVTNPTNGHQYAITLDWSNWLQAETWAEEIGGHLVTINDATENTWLSSTFKGYYSKDGLGDHNRSLVWIGLEQINANWQWVSGEPVTFDPPWYGDPPPHIGTHAYLHTDTHHAPGTWWEHEVYDVNPDSYAMGIIEIPEPATLLLFGIGGLALKKRKQS